MEAESSSAAVATVWTLLEVCSDADPTAKVWRWVSSAVTDIDWAAPRMSSADVDTASITWRTLASKRSASSFMPRLRSASAAVRVASCWVRSASASIIMSLKTATASAIEPSSSRRSRPGIATSVSPCASRPMVPRSRSSGRDNPRPTSSATRTEPSRTTPVAVIRYQKVPVSTAVKLEMSLTSSMMATGSPAKFFSWPR